MKRIGIGLLSLFAFSGCLYTSISAPSAFPRPEVRTDVHDMQVVGPVSGESCGTEIIGLIFTGDFGYADAYNKALQTSGGTALFDVKTDMHVTAILGELYATVCTRVSGIAVK
jgi:hypothetical protein